MKSRARLSQSWLESPNPGDPESPGLRWLRLGRPSFRIPAISASSARTLGLQAVSRDALDTQIRFLCMFSLSGAFRFSMEANSHEIIRNWAFVAEGDYCSGSSDAGDDLLHRRVCVSGEHNGLVVDLCEAPGPKVPYNLASIPS